MIQSMKITDHEHDQALEIQEVNEDNKIFISLGSDDYSGWISLDKNYTEEVIKWLTDQLKNFE